MALPLAFLLPLSPRQPTNTWMLGALCVASAMAALAAPQANHPNSVLAVWLLVSALALPATFVGTINAVVAGLTAAFSLESSPREPNPIARRPARSTAWGGSSRSAPGTVQALARPARDRFPGRDAAIERSRGKPGRVVDASTPARRLGRSTERA